jgi:hypothetical protein
MWDGPGHLREHRLCWHACCPASTLTRSPPPATPPTPATSGAGAPTSSSSSVDAARLMLSQLGDDVDEQLLLEVL